MNIKDTNIADELKLLINGKSGQFERRWTEYYSTLPPFDTMSWREQDKFKEYTWKIYEDILDVDKITLLLQRAFDKGFDKGSRVSQEFAIAKIEKIVKNIDDATEKFHENINFAVEKYKSDTENNKFKLL